MKKLFALLMSLTLGSSVFAGVDPNAPPNPNDVPEPSKVWGYITMKDPSDMTRLHLPGYKNMNGRKPTTSLLTIVLKDPGGIEHTVLVNHPFPYVSRNECKYNYDDPSAIAIRYEIRFAHYQVGDNLRPGAPYLPFLGGAIGFEGMAGQIASLELEPTPTNVFTVPTDRYPAVVYDPSHYRFVRIEAGNLLYLAHPERPDRSEAVLVREPAPIDHPLLPPQGPDVDLVPSDSHH
jgi:hypothetical protein